MQKSEKKSAGAVWSENWSKNGLKWIFMGWKSL